jgi:hypothetical protein
MDKIKTLNNHDNSKILISKWQNDLASAIKCHHWELKIMAHVDDGIGTTKPTQILVMEFNPMFA